MVHSERDEGEPDFTGKMLGDVAQSEDLYAAALWRAGQVVDRVEAWMEGLPDKSTISPTQVLPQVADLHAVYDQVALVLEAHVALGILHRAHGSTLVLDRSRLEATHLFRLGFRVGFRHAAAINRTNEIPRLVAALPVGIPSDLADAFRRQADDLRAALIALITAARNEVVIASPFWDDETVADLEGLLTRRIEAGIRVTVLGRRPTVGDTDRQHGYHGFARLANALSSYASFHAFVWEEPLPEDRFGVQTFHFKCIVIDYGRQAYLGTANLTSASLRSRMELGTILSGEAAEQLASILSGILKIALPLELPETDCLGST